MWVGRTDGDQISYTPQKQTQPVGSVCRASPESNCCSENNLAAHAGWSKPLPPLSFLLSIHPAPPPSFSLLSLVLLSLSITLWKTQLERGRLEKVGEFGHEEGKKQGKGFSSF